MSDFNEKDGELLNVSLSHGLIFPEEFKERVKDAILRGLRNVSYKSVPGINALRGRKLLQISGTVGVFNFVTGGYVKMSASAPVAKTDVKVSGIADGKYMIMWDVQISAANAWAGLSINGDTPQDADSLNSRGSTATFSRCLIRTLKNDDNNTIELMCNNVGAGSAFLDYISITIIKIADQ